jgi:hypothetical protein
MNEPTINFKLSEDRDLQKNLSWPDERSSFSDEDFLSAALFKNEELLSNITAPKARAEFLFYFLVQVGRYRPALFPIPDVCLAAFNILAAKHNLAESRLVCLDLGLLPAAVLAAGWGAKVVPPLSAQDKSWPVHFLQAGFPYDRKLEGALVLGRDPVKLAKDNPDLLDQLANIKGGIIFCYWDFLGVKLHKKERLKWLERGLLQTVIQFPRPSRQGVIYYPALIEIGPGFSKRTSSKIRVVDIKIQAPGPGGINQAEVLRLVQGQAKMPKSFDAALEDLTQGAADCTPKRILTSSPKTETINLGRHAQLIRCQWPRTKTGKTGQSFCGEINLSQLDEHTGFVNSRAGQKTWLQEGLSEDTADPQYYLKQNDILICFRGSEATIGRVGFVAEPPPEKSLICGQSLCLVRTTNVDPVWLYYYLRNEVVRQKILSYSSGNVQLTVNLGNLRALPIAMPEPTQTEEIKREHEKLLNLIGQIREINDAAEQTITLLDKKISDFFI